MARRAVNTSSEPSPPRAENVCEHGDHPAPAGKRFCSYACETCEGDSFGAFSDGCSGLCERLERARKKTRGGRP